MFHTFLVQPIYNAFVFLVAHMPQGDAGLAIIALTIIMRLALYPVFTASIRSQMGMQAMQGEMDAVSVRYKDDPEQLARERIALLKKYKVNPLAAIAALVIQLMVLLALYGALFWKSFPTIDTSALYSFVPAPETVSSTFFGLINLLTPHHIVLALLVGATQYVAIQLTLKRSPKADGLPAEKAQMQRMQQQLMLYVMPALMAGVTYFFPGAVGLYFLTSNSLSVVQEWLIRRHVL